MTEALAIVVLPLLASAIHALGFWKYNLQAKKGTSKPKFVSWAIWSFMAILNSLSFMAITSLIVALQTFVGAAGCCGTFVHALITGKFEWPTWKEWAILVIGIIAVVVWKFYNPLSANLVLVTALVIFFWSTWESVWADPTEKSLPWLLWGSAYGLTAFVTFLLGGFSLKLAMPIILTLAHLSVPIICAYQNKKSWTRPLQPRTTTCPRCHSARCETWPSSWSGYHQNFNCPDCDYTACNWNENAGRI